MYRRVVHSQDSPNVGNLLDSQRALYWLPGVLVCKESRGVALLKYELTFSGNALASGADAGVFEPRTYFNFERDILYFRKVWQYYSDWEQSLAEQFAYWIEEEQFQRIKHIGVDLVSSYPTMSLYHLDSRNPKGLRTLYMCSEDNDLDVQDIHFQPLEEIYNEYFLAEAKRNFRAAETVYKQWTERNKDTDAIDFDDLGIKGLYRFPNIIKALEMGDSPDLVFVNAVNLVD